MKHITQNFGFICTEIHCWYIDFLNYLILSDISTLGVPDEGYSRNASFALNLISTFLLDKRTYDCIIL